MSSDTSEGTIANISSADTSGESSAISSKFFLKGNMSSGTLMKSSNSPFFSLFATAASGEKPPASNLKTFPKASVFFNNHSDTTGNDKNITSDQQSSGIDKVTPIKTPSGNVSARASVDGASVASESKPSTTMLSLLDSRKPGGANVKFSSVTNKLTQISSQNSSGVPLNLLLGGGDLNLAGIATKRARREEVLTEISTLDQTTIEGSDEIKQEQLKKKRKIDEICNSASKATINASNPNPAAIMPAAIAPTINRNDDILKQKIQVLRSAVTNLDGSQELQEARDAENNSVVSLTHLTDYMKKQQAFLKKMLVDLLFDNNQLLMLNDPQLVQIQKQLVAKYCFSKQANEEMNLEK